MTGVINLAAEP